MLVFVRVGPTGGRLDVPGCGGGRDLRTPGFGGKEAEPFLPAERVNQRGVPPCAAGYELGTAADPSEGQTRFARGISHRVAHYIKRRP